jgi:hypothetical protein
MNHPYQAAIDEALRKLEEVHAQEREAIQVHEELLQKYDELKKLLTGYIERTRHLMNLDLTGSHPTVRAAAALPMTNMRSQVVNAPGNGAPLWQSAAYAMRGRQEPFTVGDVLNAMKHDGVEIISPNRVQIMRKTLLNKPTVFKKVEQRGKFMLQPEGIQENEKEAHEGAS